VVGHQRNVADVAGSELLHAAPPKDVGCGVLGVGSWNVVTRPGVT